MKIGFAGHVSTESVRHLLDTDPDALPRGYYGAPLMATLISELLRRGHHVFAYTTSSDMAPGQRIMATGPRFKLTYCAARPRAFRYSNGQWGRAADGFSREREALVRSMQEDAPDFVHAHWCYEFAQAAIDSGLPHIVTCHDAPHVVLNYSRDLYRLVRYLMARRVLRRASHLTAVSPYLRDQLASMARAPVTVVPNPLPDWTSHGERLHRLDPAAPRILTLLNGWGRLKNPTVALSAFARLRLTCPGARLRMVGTDYEPGGRAEQWARAEGVAEGVDFVGSLPHDAVRAELLAADVLLHPALEETFGMAVAEAMSVGVPVVGGEGCGAVPWVVGEGGVITDVRDPAAVANALTGLLSDAGAHQRLAEAGRQACVRRFGMRQVVDAYETRYAEIVAAAGAAHDGICVRSL